MKKILIISLLIFSKVFFVMADEGMWIPLLLKSNEARMKKLGMKLSVEDIYSINSNSLKDAIVLFGRGCTGEVISDEGLLITNHHCGYGQIQAHSTVENDYLKDGFWATSNKEELVNPGLSVSFLVRMEDVTQKVLKGVNLEMSEAERNKIIEKNIKETTTEATEGTHYEAIIKDIYNGNQYFMFVNEVFKDVRLVGTPPSSIGKFGGDTDNWMWPRHTGDFSLFRIYANKDNLPAEYSADNIPYVPKKHLPISIKGVNKGDFTFVYGFPGSTNQFATSYEVSLIKDVENPIAIKLRGMRLDIIDAHMKTDAKIRIQYSAKHASIANGWKKWIGENKGLQKLNTIENKQKFEESFQKWAESSNTLKEKYAGLLPMYKRIYEEQLQVNKDFKYFVEAGLGSEIITYAWKLNNLYQVSKNKEATIDELNKVVEQAKKITSAHFKNYNFQTDKDLFEATMKAYKESFYTEDIPKKLQYFDKENIPEKLLIVDNKFKGDFAAYTENLFNSSVLASEEKMTKLLNSYTAKKYKTLDKDPAFSLSLSLFKHYFKNTYPGLSKYEVSLDSLNRIYLQGLMEMQKDKQFYPDANLTLRVTYGQVDDYKPADGIFYNYYTTLDGIFEKEKLGYDDYVVHPRLKELYKTKDFGPYAFEGKMPVCFIASNHTTGGNSGSPVINAYGQLIGINFDRNWEGTMSDLNYDPEQCRNISLDMRYVLFIIDKFAGASRLIEEIEIIK